MRRKNNIKENCNVDTLNPDSCDPVVSLLPFFCLVVRHYFLHPETRASPTLQTRVESYDAHDGQIRDEDCSKRKKTSGFEKRTHLREFFLSFSLSFFSFARAPK